MKVLLLAAGRSKRMKPIEDKNFLKFLGKPLLQHQLDMLEAAGLHDVVVVGGAHNMERIEGLAHKSKMNVEVVEQVDLDAGMCGAVLAAKDAIAGGPVMVVSANDMVEVEAFELMKKAFTPGDPSDSYILGKKVETYFPGGYLKVDSDGYITEIVEKPEPGTEPSDMINLVVHLHNETARLIEYLEKVNSKKDDMYEVALSNMIKDGVKMQAIEYDGFWQPVKFPCHVMPVFDYLFSKAEVKIDPSAQIADGAIVNGDVIMGKDVKVFDGAVINGPAYIGDGSVIATNALVRGSNINENCVVGFNTEIARSFLGDDVWTHSNYIGDSVIGDNVSFGAGTITGNLRLDEKNIGESGVNKYGLVCGNDVRVGVNTCFMPGVKIGTGSFVGAGIVIAKDIEDGKFVRGKWELKVSDNKCKIDAKSREDIRKNLKK